MIAQAWAVGSERTPTHPAGTWREGSPREAVAHSRRLEEGRPAQRGAVALAAPGEVRPAKCVSENRGRQHRAAGSAQASC